MKALEANQKTVAVVNEVNILLIENGEKLVPINPICDALGIDAKNQRDKIKDDDFLSSTGVLSTSVAADGKSREMYCLPLKYIFGWLFTINPKNVKEEAKESVAKYRIQCYDILYRHFTQYQNYIEFKNKKVDEALDKNNEIRVNFRDTKIKLNDSNKEVDQFRKMTFEEYEAYLAQTKLEL
ncbi:phage antirepressor N-terminal domain-containing protein [Sphingobacterium siyangense]|uniref:phage antirepressor N-terminal domain-containing protein n=1 Tax=Sphingobacterium siyangense TaxID=459529 RepID=UPI003DA20460